jgi:hypothetical protein
VDVAGRVAEARGGILDGLAALQGVVDLLRSRRIGAKALTRALPDVGEGLAAVESAIEDLFTAITPPFVASAAVVGQATAVLAALRAPLVERGPLDARRRITLEASLLGARRELEAVLLVAELAVHASTPETSALDLADLLHHRWSGVRAGDAEIALSMDLTGMKSDAQRPRVVACLLDVALSSVVAAGVVSPSLVAGSMEGRTVLRVAAEAAPRAHPTAVRAYVLGPGKIALALEAARRADVEVVFEASGQVIAITI